MIPIFETYKQRKRKAARAGTSEVYAYDQLPNPLRIQLSQVILEALGGFHTYRGYELASGGENNEAWVAIYKHLLRVNGQDFLVKSEETPQWEIINYIRTIKDVDDALSAVELCCRWVQINCSRLSDYDREEKGITIAPDRAISEINYWFREAAVGYQFENGEIIRVDSQLIHAEIVKPALTLLSDPRFSGPEQEFLQAHRHYRSGQYKDAVNWANKAFESTMKVVCDIRRWTYPQGARASDLLKVLRANKLWPDYLDASFDQLAATLSSGLPKVRNEEGGHGDGAEPKQTPAYIAAYALHLAGTKILLICEAAGLR